MSTSRREFLRRSLIVVPATLASSASFVRALRAAPGSTNKNLILIELFGGNDGTNTIIPFGLNGGAYYSEYRPTIGVSESSILKVSGQFANQIGFHPGLAKLKTHFDQGRVNVIHGVTYPNPSFSHEYSARTWATGDLNGLSEGWLARWLNLYPAPSFPCAADILYYPSYLISGSNSFIPAIESIEELVYPSDDWYPNDTDARKAAFTSIVNAQLGSSTATGTMAKTGKGLVELIDTFATVPEFNHVGVYPEHWFADNAKLVVRLLASNLGMRVFHLGHDGFDTHSDQITDDYHGERLGILSDTIDALHTDLVAMGQDQNTLIVVFTEFGRTIYENGSLGTDHGTVTPVIVMGGGVVGGFTGNHPSLDPNLLSQYGELEMENDFRNVFGTILKRHFGENQSTIDNIFHGHNVVDLGFLT